MILLYYAMEQPVFVQNVPHINHYNLNDYNKNE